MQITPNISNKHPPCNGALYWIRALKEASTYSNFGSFSGALIECGRLKDAEHLFEILWYVFAIDL